MSTETLLQGLEPLPEHNGSTRRTEWHIAWAHLRSREHAVLLNLTTFLAVSGVIAGVALLNCVVAVMMGFELDLKDKLIRSDAHVRITHVDGISEPAVVVQSSLQVPGVLAAAAYVEGEVMLRSASRSTGVVVKGVDVERVHDVSDLDALLVRGMHGVLKTPEERRAALITLGELHAHPRAAVDESKLPTLMIGKTLAETLLVYPGDSVQLINPVGQTIGMLGMPQPATRMFRVAGVFESGQYELDAKRVYMELDVARSFLQIVGATGIELAVVPDSLDATTEALAVAVPELDVLDWRDLNRTLFEALHLQRYVMSLLLSMTIGVAALLIVSTLYMVVITKRGEIAVLKALGASDGLIRRVFVMQGTFVGTIGVLLGTVLGKVGCFTLWAYGWPLDADIYAMATLPVVVDPRIVLSIALGAFTICALFTLMPASAAASVDPIEGLRLD